MSANFYAEVNLQNAVQIRLRDMYQYNRGFSLRIRGYDGIETPQGQFAFEGVRQTLNVTASVPSGADYYEIEVPDVVLYQPKTVHCYIYASSGTHGETVHDIVIPIVPREKPADVNYTPEEIASFDALLAELNSSKDKIAAITEVVYAGSGVMWADVDDNHTLVFEKAMLDAQENAYAIARKNGFDGSQADWNAFVDDLLSHATPDQAMAAAQQAAAKADNAVDHMDDVADQMAQDMSNCKQDLEAYMLLAANGVASRSATVTIASTDWTPVVGHDDRYTATKSCAIVTASNNLLVGIKGPLTDGQFSDIGAASIICETQTDLHQLTFTCYGDKPNNSLDFNVIAFLDGDQSEGPQTLQNYRLRLDETDGNLYLDIVGEGS